MTPAATSTRPARGVRPRYARLGAVLLSSAATVVAGLGSAGVLGAAAMPAVASADRPARAQGGSAALASSPTRTAPRAVAPAAALRPAYAVAGSLPGTSDAHGRPVPAAPADSGEGRRVVFDQSRQRVWLVSARDQVRRSYLVSGSVYDNLHPGTYQVTSRQPTAYGIDDSGTMKWFVVFTSGQNAAIGFHDIPVKDGEPLQTADELGTPTSHGCIRQQEPDAKAMWRFAQLGDTVVVVA